MAVTTQRSPQARLVQPASQTKSQRRRKTKSRRSQKVAKGSSFIASSLKASIVGGIGVLVLSLISLIPFQFLAFLVIPGFLVVWLSTGMLAAIFAGDNVTNSQQGGKVGWMAGFWSGIYGGLIAMIMAATGMFMINFGQGIANQFPPSELPPLLNTLTPNTIAIMGRVFGALIVFGVIGSLIAGLFSSFGGMLYPKLVVNNNE
ncbi:MAG: hypothetical protein R3264_04390 [Anaerolineae bacterium]|nr:hypothetical protein [Anaerolineae bacterium]